MMKSVRRSLCVFLLLTLLTVQAGAADAAYEWVVPMEYGGITAVFDGRFLVRNYDAYEKNPDAQDLYALDGTLLLSAKWNWTFYEHYIVAEDEGGVGIWRREDCSEVFPERFKRVLLTGAHTAEACTGGEFHPPGYWIGDFVELDLAAGTVTRAPDIVSETQIDAADYEWPVSGPEAFANIGGPYGMQPQDMDGSGNFSVLRNGDGQLLLDTSQKPGWLSYGCDGTLLWWYYGEGTESYYETYTGRGRLLGAFDSDGVYGGRYLLRGDEGQYLTDRDGETVIAPGVFGNYDFNTVNNYVANIVSDDDSLVIVEKGGKYGVIRLADRMPAPSPWAVEEAGKAVEAGLVPEDVRLWWRDPCTRLEFCRMLARTVEAATGGTIQSLVSGASPVTFSDCSDPDVLAAASLGIVQGVGGGKFAPGCFLNREMAATMLARTAERLQTAGTGEAKQFSDADEFSTWASKGIGTVTSIISRDGKAVMQGTGGGRFSPKESYTVEQSALTLYRLLRAESGVE